MSTALPRVAKKSSNLRRIVIVLAILAACLAGVVGYLVFSQVMDAGQPATAVDRDIDLLQAQVLKTPEDPTVLARLAELEYEKGRVADALQHGAQAVEHAGTIPEVRLQYAGILLRQNRPTEAKKLAQAEIDLSSTTSEANGYFILAQAQRDMGDQKGALASMVEGLRRDPYAADARILYADMLRQSGDTKAAIAQYEAGLLFLPKDARATAALRELGVKSKESTATPAGHGSASATTTK